MKKLWKATHNKRDQAEAGKGYSEETMEGNT